MISSRRIKLDEKARTYNRNIRFRVSTLPTHARESRWCAHGEYSLIFFSNASIRWTKMTPITCKEATTYAPFTGGNNTKLMAPEQDYGFEYSDDDQMQDGGSADVENQYYTAKSKKEDNPEAALKLFKAIVDTEETKGDWYVYSLPSRLARPFLISNKGASKR
jgi:hypothetical protein